MLMQHPTKRHTRDTKRLSHIPDTHVKLDHHVFAQNLSGVNWTLHTANARQESTLQSTTTTSIRKRLNTYKSCRSTSARRSSSNSATKLRPTSPDCSQLSASSVDITITPDPASTVMSDVPIPHPCLSRTSLGRTISPRSSRA